MSIRPAFREPGASPSDPTASVRPRSLARIAAAGKDLQTALPAQSTELPFENPLLEPEPQPPQGAPALAEGRAEPDEPDRRDDSGEPGEIAHAQEPEERDQDLDPDEPAGANRQDEEEVDRRLAVEHREGGDQDREQHPLPLHQSEGCRVGPAEEDDQGVDRERDQTGHERGRQQQPPKAAPAEIQIDVAPEPEEHQEVEQEKEARSAGADEWIGRELPDEPAPPDVGGKPQERRNDRRRGEELQGERGEDHGEQSEDVARRRPRRTAETGEGEASRLARVHHASAAPQARRAQRAISPKV